MVLSASDLAINSEIQAKTWWRKVVGKAVERSEANVIHLFLEQVGCSQLLKESEKPLQTGLTTGLNENQSGGPLGGDSPSAGEYSFREPSRDEAAGDVFEDLA